MIPIAVMRMRRPPFRPISATGGTVTDVEIGGRLYRVHDFTSSGDFEVTDLGSESGAARALAVGGGASGANAGNGHGPAPGAGGNVTEQDVTLTISISAIVIGAPGASVLSGNNGNSGSNTTGLGLDADGGGFGGTAGFPGGNADNGGGGGAGITFGNNPAGGAGIRNGGAGYGTDFAERANRASGGSAGAGTAGGNASSATGGTGGDGKESSIDGTSRYYGAGVSGYAFGGTIPPAPLGGVKGTTYNAVPNAGTDGLGNGGAAYGGSDAAQASGPGGSGRFIICYPLEAAA